MHDLGKSKKMIGRYNRSSGVPQQSRHDTEYETYKQKKTNTDSADRQVDTESCMKIDASKKAHARPVGMRKFLN